MASFDQLERAINKARQSDGIRAAEVRGVYKGRARKLASEQLAAVRELISAGVPKAEVARWLSLDRSILYRIWLVTHDDQMQRFWKTCAINFGKLRSSTMTVIEGQASIATQLNATSLA